MSGDAMSSPDAIDRHLELLTQWVAALKRCGDRRDCAEAVLHALGHAVIIEERFHDIARGLGLHSDTDSLREMLRRPAPKARPHLVIDNTKEE